MKLIAGIALCLLLFSISTLSQTGDWKMIVRGTEYSNVTLLAVENDTVKCQLNSNDGRVPVDSIMSLSRHTGAGKTARSVIIGGLGLGATAYLLALVMDRNDARDSYSNNSSSESSGNIKVILPILGVAVGAGLGAALAPAQETVQIKFARMSHQERISIINSLLAGRD